MIAPPDDEAHAAALAGLTGMSLRRLARLLEGFRPSLAWRAVASGTHPADPEHRFLSAARQTDVAEVDERYRTAGARVLLPGRTGYPSALAGDPTAPAVLFGIGDSEVLHSSATVAVVGTRSATAYGRRVAVEMGSSLAEEGVVVVSGLARGIDSAAHAGALRASSSKSAPPVAVVGTGLDVVYPSSSAELWEKVARRGAILTASPLGTTPQPWVFPARNRIVAALVDVVVVVECHRGGGSFTTVEAAARRSVPVCAVPGSVHSPSSTGTNALLVDGCVPVRDATDVLVALSLARAGKLPFEDGRRGAAACHGTRRTPESPGAHHAKSPAGEAALTDRQRAVWAAVDETPTVFETILLRTNLPIPEAAQACHELLAAGRFTGGPGWWSRAG